MAPKPQHERKPGSSASAKHRVLPMELQIGDRLIDETGEWVVASRPFMSGGGKTASARITRVSRPSSGSSRCSYSRDRDQNQRSTSRVEVRRTQVQPVSLQTR